MKKFLIIILTSFIACLFAHGQADNYDKAEYVFVRSYYEDPSCNTCAELANELFVLAKDRRGFFSKSVHFPDWEHQKDSKGLHEYYDDDEFFVVSEIQSEGHSYVIDFSLFDIEGRLFQSSSFHQKIRLNARQVDYIKILDMLENELSDFKKRGSFKNAIYVKEFDVKENTNAAEFDAEDFRDWLVYELKNHKILKVNYHIYRQDEDSEVYPNKLDGDFFQPPDNNNIRMKMTIVLGGKQKKCKTLIISQYEYDELDKDGILEEIIKKIKQIENGKN